jgi:hypothetical protein
VNSAHGLLIALGFSFNQKVENLILYQTHGKAFILTEEGGIVTKVQYKMTDKAIYYDCIKYAKETLAFETIFEEFEPSADILRLDDEKCTLIGMVIHTNSNHLSLGITLLAKLPLPTPENKVEVILRPPPLS